MTRTRWQLLNGSVYLRNLDEEFTRCTRWPGQSSIIDHSYECGECKGSVHLTLTTIFCRCQQTVQLPPAPKPIQLKQTTSPKTAKKWFEGNYITTMYFVLCIVCCVCVLFVVYHSTVLCQQSNANFLIFFHNNIKI